MIVAVVGGCNLDSTLPPATDAPTDAPTSTQLVQQAYLKGRNTEAGDQLGPVAMSADGLYLVVGAPFEDSTAEGVDGDEANNDASESGAAYVFVREGATWSQQAYLKASNTGAMDHFGISVAISRDGTTVVVGAPQEDSVSSGINQEDDDDTLADSGAVYVFTRNNTQWSQQAYIKASNPGVNDGFGNKVTLSGDGDTLAVGARENSGTRGIDTVPDEAAADAGAVYVFTRVGGTWQNDAYIKASNAESGDLFGDALSLSGDGLTLAVSAKGEDSSTIANENDNAASNSGAVYIFTRATGAWAQQAYLKPTTIGADDLFGAGDIEGASQFGLSEDGSTLAVGAFVEDSSSADTPADNTVSGSGAAYVFVRVGTTWSQAAYLKASNPDAGDNLGESIALSRNGLVLAIGARREDSAVFGLDGNQLDNSADRAGAVYLFAFADGAWRQVRYLKASNTDADDQFGLGISLSADGSTFAVTAHLEDGIAANEQANTATDSGAVYVFATVAQ